MVLSTWSLRLPAHDHDLWIVRAAYVRQFPRSMAELGRTLGLSRSQTSRTVQRLVDEGFIVESQDSYDFNENHPLAAELGRWIYLMTGAERPNTSWPALLQRTEAERIAASKTLPAHWRTVDISAEAGEVPTHSALEARQAAIAISEACRGLRRLEDLLQDAYSDVKAERARDFVHLLIGLTGEVELAGWLLRQHAARQDVSRQQNPLEAVVYQVEWERAGFLLDAQVDLLESVAEHVTRAYESGRDARRKREVVAGEMEAYLSYNADAQARVLGRVTQKAREIGELREKAREQGLFRHGGMPGFDEVGTLGDLVVKHSILRTRDDLRAAQKRYALPSAGDSSR